MIEQKTFVLPKIGCQGCMKKVVNALTGVPSVEITNTDVPAKSVSLCYDTTAVNTEQIEEVLHAIGHKIIQEEMSRPQAV